MPMDDKLPYIITCVLGLILFFAKFFVHGNLIDKAEGGFNFNNDMHRLRLMLPVTMEVPNRLKWVRVVANIMYVVAIAALALGGARLNP
jgi:hypothetical protein